MECFQSSFLGPSFWPAVLGASANEIWGTNKGFSLNLRASTKLNRRRRAGFLWFSDVRKSLIVYKVRHRQQAKAPRSIPRSGIRLVWIVLRKFFARVRSRSFFQRKRKEQRIIEAKARLIWIVLRKFFARVQMRHSPKAQFNMRWEAQFNMREERLNVIWVADLRERLDWLPTQSFLA